MERLVCIGKPFGADVGINLGGADVRVSQHFLDGPQVGAVIKQMGGKGMTQRMGRHVLRYIGLACVPFHHTPHGGAAKPLAGSADE